MNLWGVELPADRATPHERAYLAGVAGRHPAPITLEQMWALTDEAWDECGASTMRLDAPATHAFYRHPVWLVNGVFTEVHPESRGHRDALARWVAGTGRREIVDFGGGYGALARRIAARIPAATIRVIDPFPSALAVAACESFPGIRYVPRLVEPAELLIAQDVLEHVGDPVGLAAHLVRHVASGGLLVFANCFVPCIKCHVPATFHLAQSFPRLMKLLGCDARGPVPGCEHALVFERTRLVDVPRWRLAAFEHASRGRDVVRRILRR